MSSKKSSAASALRGFGFNQPLIGFSTKFRTIPTKDKSETPQVHKINYGANCREELVWDVREYLQSKTVAWKQNPNNWERMATLQRTVDLDHPSLKQPLVTYLWASNDNDYEDAPTSLCTRSCCVAKLPHLLDAVVGTVAVALNPDRYVGDWWRTSTEELLAGKKKYDEGESLRWYGTDNFFLRHPVLTSLIMGMFRQAVLLQNQGFDEAILASVQRKEVEDCLTNADPELALKILNQLKPWIAVSPASWARNFSFPAAHWDRLRLLQRTAFKHGYDALFGPGIQKAWNLAEKDGKKAADAHGNHSPRYDITTGPVDYFGTSGTKKNPSGIRLAQLGK